MAQRIETIRKELRTMYAHLAEAFGIYHSSWSQIHENYSPAMFCPANRLQIVGEYLVWKDFVEDAKRYDIMYYHGIDTFLEEYKHAVESVVDFTKFE